MADRRPKLDEVVRYRLAEISDLFTSGLGDLTGKIRREYTRGEGQHADYGDVAGRFGGVKAAFPELRHVKEGPGQIAQALARGKGPLYDRVYASVAEDFARDFEPARKRSRGRASVRPHKRLRRYCVHCETFHTKDAHRFHGKHSFHRTHAWGFKNPGDEPGLLFGPGGFEQPESASKATLGRDEREAERMLYGGRGMVALRKGKTFDKERLESSPLFAPTRPSLFTNRGRGMVSASRTFAELMATARRRSLTAAEKVRLTKARQALRRGRHPAMNRPKKKRQALITRTVKTNGVKWVAMLETDRGGKSKRFGNEETAWRWLDKERDIQVSRGRRIKIANVGKAFTKRRPQAIRPRKNSTSTSSDVRSPTRTSTSTHALTRGNTTLTITGSRNTVRVPRGNPAKVLRTKRRIGRIVELRYDRDTGGHRGFYKHTFKTNASVYILPGNQGILIR